MSWIGSAMLAVMHGKRRASGLLLLLLLACVWRPSCSCSSPARPSGMLVFFGDVAGVERWRWLDLETGASGDLGYYPGVEVWYTSDRRAVWMLWTGEQRNKSNGVLRVSRQRGGIATHYIRDVAVTSVAPDGVHATLVPHYPGNREDVLQLGRLTSAGFEPGPRLGVPFMETTVFGWDDSKTLLVSGQRDELLRVTPGKRPVEIRDLADSHAGTASHDMRLFAWTRDPHDNEHQELHIVSLRDPTSREQVLPLGAGREAKCEFAPGDRTIACMVGDSYAGTVRVYAIDVATNRVTLLSKSAGPTLAFSPDGTRLMLFEHEMTIVSVDGKGPRVTIGKQGAPVAWIR